MLHLPRSIRKRRAAPPLSRCFALLVAAIASVPPPAAAAEDLLDFTSARVVLPEDSSGPEKKAVEMLLDEVEKRTGTRWRSGGAWPEGDGPVIALGRAATLAVFAAKLGDLGPGLGAPAAKEGYRLRVDGAAAAPQALVIGSDARGVLFGAGRLLRILRLRQGSARLPAGIDLATSPRYPLRGHQLGYRPKTNSYDGWTLALWEQYLRDLAVFGANAVELIPPRSDDDAVSPHFPLPPLQMMRGMSRLLDEYGFDVWIWYPAMDEDYADPRTVESALREWGEVFQSLPRIDAVFVPGGDPGHTRPRHLLALLEKQAKVLRGYHPRAEMWVSPQSFTKEWMDEFLEILTKEEPAWLSGVVFGPQVRGSLAGLRSAVPRKYPLRHYPDITHTRQCQYPVADWDAAYAVTEGREPINPRPEAEARIFRLLQEHSIGFITYSEGCNDDVNKAVWSALGWDPGASVIETLRDYGRYFIGEDYADSFAQGLLALERNWEGPLLPNAGVYGTLAQLQSLERSASPSVLRNWRFQQALYRAYYDAYVRSRLIQETALEERALSLLRRADKLGSLAAMAEAEVILGRAVAEPVSADWRSRVFELAEALYQSIRMQLSVERYRAISVGRGANLDTIDVPLNAAPWLRRRFEEIRKIDGERERLAALEALLRWTDPGPGGFYDDLGDPLCRPHLVGGRGFRDDPAFLESALTGFSDHFEGPLAWRRHAEALQDAPLLMRYSGLDPGARYRLRVVYAGDSPRTMIRLETGQGIEIHPLIRKESPVRPVEFDLPPQATATGELDLRWSRPPGLGGNGRGCQVSEVWLLRK
jgi:hypothetical protein